MLRLCPVGLNVCPEIIAFEGERIFLRRPPFEEHCIFQPPAVAFGELAESVPDLFSDEETFVSRLADSNQLPINENSWSLDSCLEYL